MLESTAYLRLPVWLQEQLLSVRAYARNVMREGRPFHKELEDVTRTQWLSESELNALQLQRLQKVVGHALLHVPYYRQLAEHRNLSPDFLHSLEDLGKLPYLTKKDVFGAGKGILSEIARGPRFSASTSGTTGMSMTAYRDLHAINRENAFVWRHMNWAGLKVGQPRVWLRGDKVVPPDQDKPPFWRHVKADNMLMMSSYHLSESSAAAYLKAMEKFDPVVIQAYPSAVLLLARYLVSSGKKYAGIRLHSVVTSSETVTEEHRNLIKQAFGCQIFDWYGAMERMVAIGNCEHGNYHVMSDYSHVEFIPGEDGTHEVVGTGFDNFLMPFIRYRIGDSVVLADRSYRCPCGRAFPVVEGIVGRVDDYVVTPSGRHVIMMCNLLDNLSGVLEGQIRQEKEGEIRVLLVPAPGHGPIDREQLRLSAASMLGSDMDVKIEEVAHIPRTRNGKLRMVVREI